MKIDIVRAWKDAYYRKHLSAEEQALVPENPAGPLELTDEDLAGVQGVHGSYGLINTAVEVCVQTTTIGKCNTIGPDCRFNF